MHRCDSKIDTNQMQACVIVIPDEKKRENDLNRTSKILQSIKLGKRILLYQELSGVL